MSIEQYLGSGVGIPDCVPDKKKISLHSHIGWDGPSELSYINIFQDLFKFGA